MNQAIVIVAAILAFGFFCVVATYALRAFIRYRGKRLVTCPETNKVVAVEVDASHAALTIGHGIPELQLKSCTRWPERHDCGQECLSQIEISPEECLVRNILTSWYQGKTCAFCHMRFGQIHLTDHKPALLNAQHRIIRWQEIPPETIPEVLATHLPVCWNCDVAESFRQEHPDLVTDRPWRKTVEAGRR